MGMEVGVLVPLALLLVATGRHRPLQPLTRPNRCQNAGRPDNRAALSAPEGVVCFGGLFLEERTDDEGGALPAREHLPAGDFEGGVFGV